MEPNYLRDEGVPNAYRTDVALARAEPRRTVDVPAPRITSRQVLLAGIFLAIVGISFFFGGEFQAQLIGTGLICLGAGIAITVIARRAVIDSIAVARRSKAGAVGALVLAPHTIAICVVGLGLIVFGLTALALGLANL
jgi:hypothetical protein